MAISSVLNSLYFSFHSPLGMEKLMSLKFEFDWPLPAVGLGPERPARQPTSFPCFLTVWNLVQSSGNSQGLMEVADGLQGSSDFLGSSVFMALAGASSRGVSIVSGGMLELAWRCMLGGSLSSKARILLVTFMDRGRSTQGHGCSLSSLAMD